MDRILKFFKNKSQKVKKVFDKGQKVRYTLTIEKNKRSNSDCLIHYSNDYKHLKKSSYHKRDIVNQRNEVIR